MHSIHVFDRKGKTLYTKTYSSIATKNQQQILQQNDDQDGNPLEEQRKLVFGMIFSLRELVGQLTPKGETRGKCGFGRVVVLCFVCGTKESGFKVVD